MNSAELLFFAVGIVAVAGAACGITRSVKAGVLTTVLLAPVVYLSLAGASQFLGGDEFFILNEAVDLRQLELRQWNVGSSRTTDVFIGTILTLLGDVPSISDTTLHILAKCIHWLLGVLLFLEITRVVTTRFVSESQRVPGFFLLMAASLLLPMNGMSLKTFNYDLFSMQLSILALLYLFVYYEDSSHVYGIFAIVSATLAAQEKLSASPVLLVVIVLAGVRQVLTGEKESISMSLLRISGFFFVAVLTSALSLAVILALRQGNLDGVLWQRMLDPLTLWLRPIVWVTPLHAQFVKDPSPFVPIAYLACIASGIALIHGARFVQARLRVSLHRSPLLFVGAFCVLIAIGIVGTYAVTVYLAPYVPVEPDLYQPTQVFNDSTRHYGAQSYLEHIGKNTLWAAAVVANTVPTVFLVVAAICVFLCNSPHLARRRYSALSITSLFFLMQPVAFGVLDIPATNRYFNIVIFASSLCFIVLIFALMNRRSALQNWAFAGAVSVALLVEVMPFAPHFAAFHPIWSDYGDAYNQAATDPERLNPWWTGWGESLGLLAPQVQALCAAGPAGAEGCRGVEIAFPSRPWGEWLSADRVIEFVDTDADFPMVRDSDRAYYLFNRTCFVARCAAFPARATPELVLEFRGYHQAWLYRGDKLIEAGYFWPWEADPADLHGAGDGLIREAARLRERPDEPLYIVAERGPLAALRELLIPRGPIKALTGSYPVVMRPGHSTLILSASDYSGPNSEFLARFARQVADVPWQPGDGRFTFYRLPDIAPTELPGWHPVKAIWGNQVVLQAVQTATPRLEPGGTARIGLAWQPGPETSRRYNFSIAVVDAHGTGVVQSNQLGYPSAQWQPDEIVLAWYNITVPPEAPEGLYTIRLSMHAEPYQGRLPLHLDPPTDPAVNSIEVGRVVVRARGEPAPAAGPVLSGQLRLVGAELAAGGTAGETLPIEVTWRAEAIMDEDYTLFVHLVDENGRLVAQHDGAPRQGTLPTSTWLPGEAVNDRIEIALPPDLAAKRLTAIAGAYDAETGLRLITESGQNQVVIGTIDSK